jgi:hypothetical protein
MQALNILKRFGAVILLAVCPLLCAASTLTVTVTGTGTVTSSPSGISCPGTCSASFSGSVTLTALSAQANVFSGWGAACASSYSLNTCTLTISGATSVSAGFPARTNKISAISFPTTGTNSAAASALISPYPPAYLSAIEVFVSVGTYTTVGSGVLAIDFENGTGACSVAPNFTNINNAIANYPTTGNNYPINLVVQPKAEGNTSTATSACVWSQAQANAVALTYTSGTVALAGYYFNVSGKYWQIKTPCYTSGFSAGCTLGTATFPGSPTLGQTYTDSNGVVTTYIGTQAAPQDGYCGASAECGNPSAGLACNSSDPGVIVNINMVVGGSTPYTCPLTGTTLTLTQLESAIPIPWELSFNTWYEQNIAALETAVNSSAPANLGYVRFGNPEGGEFVTTGMDPSGGTPFWPYAGSSLASANAQFETNIQMFDAFIAAQSQAFTSRYALSDISGAANADQDAYLADYYGFWGIGNQDFDLQDYTYVVSGSYPCSGGSSTGPPTAGTGCTQGDWLYNSWKYPNRHHEVQLLQGSNPADCNLSDVNDGPLAPLPSGSAHCAAGHPGMLPFLTNLCVGSGYNGYPVCVDVFESPTNSNGGTSPTADASDTFLALYSGYAGITGAVAAYLPYAVPYKLAFCQYLAGGTCSTTVFPPSLINIFLN